jgi:hypothetical protein
MIFKNEFLNKVIKPNPTHDLGHKLGRLTHINLNQPKTTSFQDFLKMLKQCF